MIDYIIGKVTEIYANAISIECNGIGYLMSVSTNTIANLTKEEMKIYIRMIVREDGITLCGFGSIKERDVFDRLITVPKVGPKAAMNLLCAFTPEEIIMTIILQDHKALSKANGVGVKTAEQIVLTLKGVFNQNDAIPLGQDQNISESILGSDAQIKRNEAIVALTSLGYDVGDANRIITSVYNDDMSLEDIIKQALRTIAG